MVSARLFAFIECTFLEIYFLTSLGLTLPKKGFEIEIKETKFVIFDINNMTALK